MYIFTCHKLMNIYVVLHFLSELPTYNRNIHIGILEVFISGDKRIQVWSPFNEFFIRSC